MMYSAGMCAMLPSVQAAQERTLFPSKGCAARPPEVRIDPSIMARVLTLEGVLAIIPDSEANCLNAGEKIVIAPEVRSSRLDLTIYSGRKFPGLIKSVRRLKLEELTDSIGEQAGMRPLYFAWFLKNASKLFTEEDLNKSFALVRVVPLRPESMSVAYSATPDQHPLAIKMSRTDIEPLVAKVAQLIVVSRPAFFKIGSVPTAKSLSMKWPPGASGELIKPHTLDVFNRLKSQGPLR